jgi:hypothetical protein
MGGRQQVYAAISGGTGGRVVSLAPDTVDFIDPTLCTRSIAAGNWSKATGLLK